MYDDFQWAYLDWRNRVEEIGITNTALAIICPTCLLPIPDDAHQGIGCICGPTTTLHECMSGHGLSIFEYEFSINLDEQLYQRLGNNA